MSETPQPRQQAARLGAELRRSRALAGKSGREISRITGISQPTISRIENGQSVPSLPQVESWCDAVGADVTVRNRLLALAEGALNEIEIFRQSAAGGLAPLQEDVRQLEATARVMRHFQISHVPGLLQTEEYARASLEYALDAPPGDIGQAVAKRLERQSILADPSRRFEFILTEAALRWIPAGATASLLRGQMDKIAAMSRLASIAIGVIPAGTPLRITPLSPFIIYDEREPGYQPFVIIELAHGAVYVYDPADIDLYRSRLAELRESALTGDAARSALAAIGGGG